VNKLSRSKTIARRGENHFFKNFQQSSCDVALALLKKSKQVQLKAPAQLD
jgi:hypothetical protein